MHFTMAKNETIDIKDVIHKLQLYLLEGIKDVNQLFAAGFLISLSDYQDVVTERSIIKICGYPLCRNPLPHEENQKGRYHVSLKEHKVYDLQETYMYCSTSCVVNSRSFAGNLPEKRLSISNPAKLNEVLGLFSELSLDSREEDFLKNGDLGLSELRIQENANTKVGEVALEEWLGPSNAIEGYVPQRERELNLSHSRTCKDGSKPNNSQIDKGKDMLLNEMEFTSVILTQDEYEVSKQPSDSLKNASKIKVKESRVKDDHKEIRGPSTLLGKSPSSMQSDLASKRKGTTQENRKSINNDLRILESSTSPGGCNANVIINEAKKDSDTGKAIESKSIILKSSLKYSNSKKETRFVTWADEQTYSMGSRNLCEFKQIDDNKGDVGMSNFKGKEVDLHPLRYDSAEACAIALIRAAEAIASGETDVSHVVSESGIIILPSPQNVDEVEPVENGDVLDPGPSPSKWPGKPGISNYNLFDLEDSWYDSPPEGFSVDLSPFATMYMALFAWISSSSLAYIYGRDESLHEDYISVNGREYPRKILATDGRSAEIRQTLAGCLARALPGLVADLGLPIPLSTLEQGMDRLLNTMSFMDPLPPLRMKQWQVIALLFIEALSVCKIPALALHMPGRRMLLLPKVVEGAQVTSDEYKMMEEIVIPLGRKPELSMQNGAQFDVKLCVQDF